MKPLAISIAKPGQGTINEDAVYASSSIVAVSDGAGGGGLYAEKWSAYLLEHLPDNPIESFKQLDDWIASIWEPFYNDCEALAKQKGGLLLDKFYDEGSFATLVAVWKVSDSLCKWMAYGDSVAFHYNMKTGKLESSFSSVSDFDKPPYLINCKDELDPKGFAQGEFNVDDGSIVFCCSDALSFYILLAYELTHCNEYSEDLQNLEKQNSRYTRCLKNALGRNLQFKDVIDKILNCRSAYILKKHIQRLLKENLICLDDYSISILPYNK